MFEVKRSLVALFAGAMLLSGVADAANIIYVERTQGTNNAQPWVDLLVNAGHTVVNTPGVGTDYRDLDTTPADIAALNAADLIILSRHTNSGDYDDNATEINAWHAVTTPIFSMAPHAIRNTDMGWFSADGPLPAAQVSCEAVDPNHPIFSGVTLGANNRVVISAQAGTDYLELDAGTAQVLGLIVNTAGTTTAFPYAAYWDGTQPFYTGGPTPAGPRVFMPMGGGLTDGEFDLTADGTTIFLNVVSFLLPPAGEGEGEGEVELFFDDFARADSATVGNGWAETDNPTDATNPNNVTIAGGKLTFADTSDATRMPLVQHAFTNTSSGQLIWSFDMDWTWVQSEGTYHMYMQLGDAALMTGAAIDTGVGVNLVWRDIPDAGPDNMLGYRVGGNNANDSGLNALASVAGPHSISVAVDLDARTFAVSVDGAPVGNGTFDNNVSLNAVRYFTDGVNEANFSGLTFDNVRIAVPGTGGGEGEGEPQGNVIVSNVYPPFIDEGTVVILTAPAGSGWQWTKDGADISGATDRELVFDPVKQSDAGAYTVTYDDGTKVVRTTPPFQLIVNPEGTVPVGGALAFAALIGACALGGATALRKR